MINDFALPKDYKPFPKIIMCGNTLINVQIPFEIDGEIPLLIGDDKTPKIWLSAPTRPPLKRWHQIVRANRSLHDAAKVIGSGTADISVTLNRIKVLKLQQRLDGIVEITDLDLRPIGLNIVGDMTQLTVGKQRFTNSTFQDVRIMVGLGVRKKMHSNNRENI